MIFCVIIYMCQFMPQKTSIKLKTPYIIGIENTVSSRSFLIMKKYISMLLVLVTVFALTACSNNEPQLPEPGEILTFQGKVLSTDPDTESIFVEAEGQDFTKAVISLHSDTELVDAEGNEIEITDIERGTTVEITNFGLMTDDYPVQMSAKKIVLK